MRNMLTEYAPKPNPKQKKVCAICSEPGKYTCPKSKKAYCSVACYKKLREQLEKELEAKIKDLEEGEELITDEEEEVSTNVKTTEVATDNNGRDPFKASFKDEDIVPPKLLDFLGEDVAMRNLLKNKRLQEILKNLQNMPAGKRFHMLEVALKNEPVFR